MKVALAGDTMLGRRVGDTLAEQPPASLVAPEVVEATREADLVVLNLECCISERGEPWPDPAKPFFFRAPPVAVELLSLLGVDCVTLANNHALDFGAVALLDTLEHLRSARIAWVGAGESLDAARAAVVLERRGFRLAVAAVADHPAAYAASEDRPGIAYADLAHGGPPAWLLEAAAGRGADATLVSPHWGPNMTQEPKPHVRATAAALDHEDPQMIQFATSANRCQPSEVASASMIRTGTRASVAARTTGSSGVRTRPDSS